MRTENVKQCPDRASESKQDYFSDDSLEPQLWKYKGFDDCDSCYWKKSFLDLIELIEMFVQSVDEIRSRRY